MFLCSSFSAALQCGTAAQWHSLPVADKFPYWPYLRSVECLQGTSASLFQAHSVFLSPEHPVSEALQRLRSGSYLSDPDENRSDGLQNIVFQILPQFFPADHFH